MPTRAGSASPFIISTADVIVSPSQVGGRGRPAELLEFTSKDLNLTFVDGRIWVPDDRLTDARLLPPMEDAGIAALSEIADTYKLNGNPEYAARRVCTFEDLILQDTERKTVPFILNPVQASYLDLILPNWRSEVLSRSPIGMHGLREFILKPRRLGFSALILGLFFLDTINRFNTQTVIIAHDQATTRKLFDVMRRFYRSLPPEKQPKTGYYSRQEMWFPELDSYIYVGTAGSGQYGRGGTINNLHASEVAFWPNPEDIVAGLFEAVTPNGNIFVESTANGYGSWYDQTYFKAKRGTPPYKARFFPWNIAPQYRKEPPENFQRTTEEEEIAQTYSLDDEQLFWRRDKIGNLGPLFPQEYPITDIEAFITSGTPYFDRIKLNGLYHTIQTARQDPDDDTSPLIYAPLPPDGIGLQSKAFPDLFREAVRISRNGKPALCVWESPQPGVMYTIGADVAEGEEHGDERDFDAASVVRVDTLEEVAVLRGQWATADYAILLSMLGYWYNEALLAPERNGPGLSVINTLQNGRPGYEQWIYPDRRPGGGGLYLAENLDERNTFATRLRRANRQGVEVIKKAGWRTNIQTKPLMLNHLKMLIDDDLIGINSEITTDELMKFVHKGNGKSGGSGSSHDDTVIALAIACFLAQYIDQYSGTGTNEIETNITASGGGRGLDGLSGLFGAGQ